MSKTSIRCEWCGLRVPASAIRWMGPGDARGCTDCEGKGARLGPSHMFLEALIARARAAGLASMALVVEDRLRALYACTHQGSYSGPVVAATRRDLAQRARALKGMCRNREAAA